MGIFKAKKPSVPKESVRPAIMIIPSTDPFPLVPPSQDTSQSAAYPLIQARKDSLIAVLKVLKPSPKGAIHLRR